MGQGRRKDKEKAGEKRTKYYQVQVQQQQPADF
jgi:hypothetical protein